MMTERNKTMTNEMQVTSDEINLSELFSAIWQGKWLIASITSVFSLAAVVFALSLPNVYKSEALLASVSEDGGIKIPGQLGGLAALAGVNLGGGGGDKTDLALEIIKSREFLSRFIEKHDLFIPVMAAEGWNRADNSLVINPDIYDATNQKWVREVEQPFLPKPSILEVHEEFLNLLAVSKDKTTSMIKISMEHYSPYLAKTWVDELIKAINHEMRQRDLIEAQRSITYLTKQVEQTNLAEVRTMLYSLIEEQTKTVMLANVRDEYVFKTLDPAVVSEKKDKPKRALIVIIAFMLGSLLSMMFVLIRYFSDKK
jgi:uncharacterized protein involved in exopolysaccharide biosynthesis